MCHNTGIGRINNKFIIIYSLLTHLDVISSTTNSNLIVGTIIAKSLCFVKLCGTICRIIGVDSRKKCRNGIDKISFILYNILMDIDLLTKAGLSKIQANIYLYLIEHGQSTPTEIAKGIGENRTTIYSAAEKLAVEIRHLGRSAAHRLRGRECGHGGAAAALLPAQKLRSRSRARDIER